MSASKDDPKDQERPTPSHGYDAVEWEGVGAAVGKTDSGKAEQESILLARLRQVMDAPDLIGSQKLILAALLSRLKGEESCILTYDELAGATSLSRRLVATQVPQLVKGGWIKKERESNSYRYWFLK